MGGKHSLGVLSEQPVSIRILFQPFPEVCENNLGKRLANCAIIVQASMMKIGRCIVMIPLKIISWVKVVFSIHKIGKIQIIYVKFFH
jgi:hypothetical protein